MIGNPYLFVIQDVVEYLTSQGADVNKKLNATLEGLTALMLAVPMSFGAAHQLGAVLLLGVALWHLHLLRYN